MSCSPRLYLVCVHVNTAADVKHYQAYNDAPGLGPAMAMGEITCGDRIHSADEARVECEDCIRDLIPN